MCASTAQGCRLPAVTPQAPSLLLKLLEQIRVSKEDFPELIHRARSHFNGQEEMLERAVKAPFSRASDSKFGAILRGAAGWKRTYSMPSCSGEILEAKRWFRHGQNGLNPGNFHLI